MNIEVSGITTTLPFFREVVRDEEFVSGQLDTGFIARFNERRATHEQRESQVEADLAVIAAALSYVQNATTGVYADRNENIAESLERSSSGES